MPVSLSATERSNPPPRKKSCGACIKAKRRCTLEVPACQRCSQRQLNCQYPAGSMPKRNTPRPPPIQDDPLPHFDHDPFGQLAGSMAPEIGTTGHGFLLSPTLALADIPMSGYTQDPNVTDVMLDPYAADLGPFHMSNIHLDLCNNVMSMDNIPDEMPIMPEISDSSLGFYLTAPMRYPLDSHAREDFLNFALKSRLRYSLDTIIASPKQMVLQNQTAWCHPNLYEHSMPRSMQDAQAACALYMAKNNVNSYVILRSLETGVRELGESPMPTDGLEILARAQALLLYHIMRVFDGDIRTREHAEAATQYLEDSVDALAAHFSFKDEEPAGDPDDPTRTLHLGYQNSGQPSEQIDLHACTTDYSYSYTATIPVLDLENRSHQLAMSSVHPRRAFWDTWIFEESARRTWILTFFLIQMYRLIKGNVPAECDGKLTNHPFTASAHLWQAPDALSFATAWKTKEHFMVKNGNFSPIFERANGDDVDVFGKLLITTLIGIDETRHWLQSRGGSL
ncbi:hypothetical protein QBC37DRAFT_187156 [Rhypophila decipiens]|uniref:Zn(2)-C6 fungal-type domain-containing protein n=1 Tax=Rhypophila decipiens TaxID=261697 RepID=A0AAN6Y5R7_9PEZI|nr:hypothetical protein QBC37DRAFT_187156 [Rhypophila decipiens]